MGDEERQRPNGGEASTEEGKDAGVLDDSSIVVASSKDKTSSFCIICKDAGSARCCPLHLNLNKQTQ